MTNEKSKVDPAYPSSDGLSAAGEAAMGVLGAAAGLAVPVVGPAVTQAILKRAIKLPLELRRSNWFNSLGEGLRELQDRFEGFDPDALGENEEFVSAVAETTRIATATHRAEKLEALRNVVLNVAAGVQIDDVLHDTFLGYVDRFSGLHLRVLKLLADPAANPAFSRKASSMMGAIEGPLLAALPELNGNDVPLKQVLGDLGRENLTDGASPHVMMTGSGLMSKRTTSVGDAFLRFISDPLER